jgi:hypothetical protein
VLEAQRAGEVGERALDCWRGGGLRGAAAAATLERGKAPRRGGGEVARSRDWRGVGQQEARNWRGVEQLCLEGF